MNNQRGLILVELIMVIILVGVIAAFAGFFLYTGFNSYLTVNNNADGAFNAQMTMGRITRELRDITEIDGSPSDTSITYKNEKLTGTRTLNYDGSQIIIRVGPVDYPLLEDVSSFKLSYSYLNLDDDTAATDEVAHINVEFKLADIGNKFTTKIFPRNLIQKTW